MTNAYISGWGKCVPDAVISNKDLSKILDTSDQWITERTGIKERRFSDLNVSDMAAHAALEATACAGIKADNIDFIILASTTPESLVPNTSSRIQEIIGASCASVDINAACSGFIYACGIASSLIKAKQYQNILVIGAEKLSFFINWNKRDTAVLFGDGAGALMLSATEKNQGIMQYKLKNNCKDRSQMTYNFGSAIDKNYHNLKESYIKFQGQSIFKNAVYEMSNISNQALKEASLSSDDIDWIIPHQANKRIITAVAAKINIPEQKAIINIDKYGNTSTASVPIAICEAIELGKIKKYQNIISVAFGAGLSCGVMLYKWGERVKPLQKNQKPKPAFCSKYEFIK